MTLVNLTLDSDTFPRALDRKKTSGKRHQTSIQKYHEYFLFCPILVKLTQNLDAYHRALHRDTSGKLSEFNPESHRAIGHEKSSTVVAL